MRDLPHTTPDDRVAAAMDGLIAEIGWNALSRSLAAWLKKQKPHGADIWISSLRHNLGETK